MFNVNQMGKEYGTIIKDFVRTMDYWKREHNHIFPKTLTVPFFDTHSVSSPRKGKATRSFVISSQMSSQSVGLLTRNILVFGPE